MAKMQADYTCVKVLSRDKVKNTTDSIDTGNNTKRVEVAVIKQPHSEGYTRDG